MHTLWITLTIQLLACIFSRVEKRCLNIWSSLTCTHVINVCFQHPITKMFIETSVHATKNRILIRNWLYFMTNKYDFIGWQKNFSEILNLSLISSPSGLLWCVHCKSDILRLAPPFSYSRALSFLEKKRKVE